MGSPNMAEDGGGPETSEDRTKWHCC